MDTFWRTLALPRSLRISQRESSARSARIRSLTQAGTHTHTIHHTRKSRHAEYEAYQDTLLPCSSAPRRVCPDLRTLLVALKTSLPHTETWIVPAKQPPLLVFAHVRVVVGNVWLLWQSVRMRIMLSWLQVVYILVRFIWNSPWSARMSFFNLTHTGVQDPFKTAAVAKAGNKSEVSSLAVSLYHCLSVSLD